MVREWLREWGRQGVRGASTRRDLLHTDHEPQAFLLDAQQLSRREALSSQGVERAGLLRAQGTGYSVQGTGLVFDRREERSTVQSRAGRRGTTRGGECPLGRYVSRDRASS